MCYEGSNTGLYWGDWGEVQGTTLDGVARKVLSEEVTF